MRILSAEARERIRRKPRTKAMDDRDAEIVRRALSGEPYPSIASDFGITRTRANDIAVRGGVPARRTCVKGRRIDPFGYAHVRIPDHPRVVYGYVREHIVVAEKKIGRPLGPDEDCHHLNQDKADNRPENIVVMGHAEHSHLHAIMRQQNRAAA